MTFMSYKFLDVAAVFETRNKSLMGVLIKMVRITTGGSDVETINT